MSVSVCVCLSVRDHISATTRPIFTKHFCTSAVARSSSGGVVIRYVLPVLRMTPCLLLSQGSQCICGLGLGYKMCAVIPVAGQQMHGTTFRVLKVFSQVSTLGAESAVYDCLVIGGRVWAWIPQREGALLGVILGPHLPAVSILHLIRLRAPPMHPATTSLLWQLDC